MKWIISAVIVMSLCVSISLAAESASPAVTAQNVAPGIWKIRLGDPEALTPVTVLQPQIMRDALQTLPACDACPIDIAKIRFRKVDRGFVAELPLDKKEQVFGFGLNLKVLNSTNLRRTIEVSDSSAIGDSHAPVPCYFTTAGYGVFVDSARYVRFYCGNLAKPGAVTSSVTQKVGLSPEELYKARELSAKNMTIEVPSAAGVDLYVFAGPDMRTSVQRYNLFSGGGAAPPLWGLGVCYRGQTDLTAAELLALAKKFRDAHIPCDMMGLEPGWLSRAYSTSFVWNKKGFPDPQAFIDQMRTMNFRLNNWEHAFTHPISPLYKPLAPFSGDYLVWEGLVPDFSLPRAREIFAQYHFDNFVQPGVAAFKLDECDNQPVGYKNVWSWPELSRFPSGLDGERMHILFGVLYQRAIMSAFEKANHRTYLQARASGPLAAPMPAAIYSDWYDHRDFVRGLTTMGFGGVLWTPELREAGSIEELYRRTQSAFLSPMALVNCWYLKNPPWMQINKDKNNRDEFLPNWEKVQDDFRKLAELRMSLIPYLYSAFNEYRRSGTPPFRALVMDYPADSKTYEIDDEYMMGPSVLVAPMFRGQAKRSVYLPAGNWYCFWTHKKYEGGQAYDIEMPRERVPMFVREGSLLPLAKPVEFVTAQTVFELTVQAFGPKCNGFTLYEDDGETFDYLRGQQNRVQLEYSGAAGSVHRTGPFKGVRYDVKSWEQIR